MSLDRLWAGWRADYVGSTDEDAPPSDDRCVLCRVVGASEAVVWRGDQVAVVLNAYPYTTGHVMAVPLRHVADLEDLERSEAAELWAAASEAVRAIKAAYRPHGLNLGANLGRAGGAGVPGHLHVHVVPRWDGDTNFMTTVAETRVLPETLATAYDRLRAAWPV